MATKKIQELVNHLEKLEWLTDDFVKDLLGKKQYKRARSIVSRHGARNFNVAFGGRLGKRVSCSSMVEGDEDYQVALAHVTKNGLADTSCKCGQNQKDKSKCDHVSVLLVTAALFKNHHKKPPHWAKAKVEDGEELNDDLREQGATLPWHYRLYVLTQSPEYEMPYEGANGGVLPDEVAEEEPAPASAAEELRPAFHQDSMKVRRRRNVYSMARKRAIMQAATENLPEGAFGRWALDHFTPDLLAALIDERKSLFISKISQTISEEEMVAFECGMQDEIEGFDDRVELLEDEAHQHVPKRSKAKNDEEDEA